MRLVVGGSDRQLVAAIVLHGVGMPLDPDEADVVMPVHAQEAHRSGFLLPANRFFSQPNTQPFVTASTTYFESE
mgnify:CR=1 FL=1